MKRFLFLALVLPSALTAFADGVVNSTTDAATPTTTAAADAATPTVNTPAEASSTAIRPIEPLLSPIVVDTLPTENPDLKVVLFNDNTWRYVALRPAEQDSTVYNKCWDTKEISAYNDVALSSLPTSVRLRLVDSLKGYRYPKIGRITSRYGIRWNRNHNGVDIALKVGDTICSAFDGRVRFSKCTSTGYGTLIILRHDNGLETYHGHLSKRLVEEGERTGSQ